jgi:aminomethyltransferase
MNVSPSSQRTPLYEAMVAAGAKFTEFAGWEMPVQFSSLKVEHEAVRQRAGLFDISHMGKLVLTGSRVLERLQKLVPSDLSRLRPGMAQYTTLLQEQGGIVDDIIIYSEGEERATLIVNAATTAKDKNWLLSHLETDVVMSDISSAMVLLALQGPEAIAVLQPLVSENLSLLPSFGHCSTTLLGETAFVARTGYTGEDGFEVMVAPTLGQALWQKLCDQGVVPCGLAARDTLRLEAALGLYGQDFDHHTTPLEAGLGWLVHFDVGVGFLGRSVLWGQKQKGVTRKLVGLQMQDKSIARTGYPIMLGNQTIGKITSGTLSPTLGSAIALGYVPLEQSAVGQSLEVEIRGKRHSAQVVKKPFYRSSQKPSRP